MAALAEVFAKQLSPALIELYWDALKPLAIEQFQAGAKSWIRHGKHFPKPADVLERFQQMEQAAPKPPPELPPPDPKWLRYVNGLFMRYLEQRRMQDLFRGDINLAERRQACRELAEFFEAIEAENDPEATEAELKIRFDRCMGRISDVSQDDAWLPIEIERQKRQDEERKRAERAA